MGELDIVPDRQLFPRQPLSPNQSILPISSSVCGGELFLGAHSVASLVARFGSPLYLLDEKHFRWACREFVEATAREYPGRSRVLFASKALCTTAVCWMAYREGLGIDVVSEGELMTALQAGVPGDVIYMHGNNKSRSELVLGISNGCTIVLDNWYELDLINGILSLDQQFRARVMPRISPEVESHTYDEVRTGQRDSKFGFCLSDLERLFQVLAASDRIDFVGVHAHVGSQLTTLEPFRQSARRMVDWYMKAKALCPSVRELNIGGGLGVSYVAEETPPSVADFVAAMASEVVEACRAGGVALPFLVIEPGRAIAAPSMITAYTVGSIKDIPGVRRYISVDGGMSDNPRPITYKSVHTVYHASRVFDPEREVVTIAGRHCESGDILFKDVSLPRLSPGDIIVAATTGAYNYSQSSNYNRVPRPAMVLVSGSTVDLLVERETIEDLLRGDRLPSRLVPRPESSVTRNEGAGH